MGPNPCDSGDVRTLRIFFRTTVTWSRIQIRHDSQHHSALQSQLSGYSESHRNPEVDYCHQPMYILAVAIPMQVFRFHEAWIRQESATTTSIMADESEKGITTAHSGTRHLLLSVFSAFTGNVAVITIHTCLPSRFSTIPVTDISVTTIPPQIRYSLRAVLYQRKVQGLLSATSEMFKRRQKTVLYYLAARHWSTHLDGVELSNDEQEELIPPQEPPQPPTSTSTAQDNSAVGSHGASTATTSPLAAPASKGGHSVVSAKRLGSTTSIVLVT
ncbi:hypothetical protein BD769DRAFT_1396996 [Suillus cothurnatus]|nr:hypothetical protein BD769DRAFT_1396996 [Suillus cothurnatus]